MVWLQHIQPHPRRQRVGGMDSNSLTSTTDALVLSVMSSPYTNEGSVTEIYVVANT